MESKITTYSRVNRQFDKYSFSQFSYDFYQQPDVENTLLRLQNQYQLNVNLVLFLIWYSFSFQHVITTRHIEQLLEAITHEDQWVTEFRNYRKDLISRIQSSVKNNLNDIKQSLLESELALELLVQTAIVQYAEENLLLTPSVERSQIIEIHFISSENLDCYFRYVHRQQPAELWDANKLLLTRLTEYLDLSAAA